MPICLERLRPLKIDQKSIMSSPPFVSAASGLLHIHDKFYVIDDDSLSLACFPAGLVDGGQRYRLLEGELPLNPMERKKSKPDLESICFLEPEIFPPFGAILAVPSGSKANRMTGALAPFVEPKVLAEKAMLIDFAPLYQELLKHFSDLNIEGCFISGGQLKFLQRGNGPIKQNALIRANLDSAVLDLISQRSLGSGLFESAREIALGALRGVNLSFTDGASIHSKETWFLAVAENTLSTYEDGRYCGAILGCLNERDEIIFQDELLCPEKPEGICLLDKGDRLKFLVVTDADDPLKPSYMYQGIRETQKLRPWPKTQLLPVK